MKHLLPLILIFSTALGNISPKPYETYLNKLLSLKAKFTQRDGAGRQSTGNLYLQKPGKMRLDYDDQPIELVADGTWFVQNDTENEESYHVLLSSTPASLFLKKNIDFQKEIKAKAPYIEEGLVILELSKPQDTEAGQLTLYFTQKPIKLVGWRTIDSKGQEINVRLDHIQENVPLKADLFTVKNPQIEKSKRSR